jgi:putative PEP-CTERM system histidine kinase
MSWFFVLTLVAALGSVALALAVFLQEHRSLAHQTFAAGMVLFCLEAIMVGLGFHATSYEQTRFWQSARFQVTALLPGVWLLFSLSFSRGNFREFLAVWQPILVAAFVFPVGVAIIGHHQLIDVKREASSEVIVLTLAPAGKFLSALLLIALVFILMNLERTFRTSVGTMRWRIKYFILGLATLFVFRLYATSQAIIYPTVTSQLWLLNTLALLIACGMIAFSLIRSEFATVDLYPSQTFLYRSFTLFLAGIYLLVVGVLAKVVSLLGGDAYFSLKAFLVMVAFVVLAVGLFSDRIRQAANAFVNRHFKRPAHDYRRIWSALSENTAAIMSETAFSQMVVNWVAETLQILSTSIWLFDPYREHLLLRATTCLRTEPPPNETPSTDSIARVAQQLEDSPEPFNLAHCQESWCTVLKQLNPTQFRFAQQQWCLPLRHRGELLGLMMLGDRVNDLPFTSDDLHLLKCVGSQVSGHLVNIRLSQKILEVKELEAFQTMSAFFVHDLKNTATTLSLLLKNFREHFDDPAFREDAFRGLSKSSQHLQDLIHRLTQLGHELRMNPASTDLNELVKTTLNCLEHSSQIELVQDLQPLPPAMLDAEQIHKVITNLLLNAVEAINSQGQIRVSTCRHGDWLVLSVADNGCGMSREFMTQRLFKPFHTTKKSGLGIGMFHSKLIVAAHHGRIEVESEPGQGALFRVYVPLSHSVAMAQQTAQK